MDNGGNEKEPGGCLATFVVGVIVLLIGGAVSFYCLIRFLDNNPGFHI